MIKDGRDVDDEVKRHIFDAKKNQAGYFSPHGTEKITNLTRAHLERAKIRT